MLLLCLATFSLAGAASAQELRYPSPPDARNGKRLYDSGCTACHGPDGKGARRTLSEFTRPSTFPDFTRCDQTTAETNAAYKDTILHGGPARGFSPIMPAFSGVLTPDQVDDIVAYLRRFCTNPHWPAGELNLPRALVTEKAYPEDELVVSTSTAGGDSTPFTTHVIHEQRFGVTNQIEVDVPVEFQQQAGESPAGLGDITLGLKRVLYSNLRSGTIVAAQGSVLAPSGSLQRGFGAGTTTFETFAAVDQLFPTNTWIQFQAGADLPVHTDVSPQSLFWYTAIGQTLAPDHRLGRQWSPMLEVLANRDLDAGAQTTWDVLPELQVSLSRRQHVRADVGVRIPVINTSGRSPQALFYVLWDWADGTFWKGW